MEQHKRRQTPIGGIEWSLSHPMEDDHDRQDEEQSRIVPIDLGMDWQEYLKHMSVTLGIMTFEQKNPLHLGERLYTMGYQMASWEQLEEQMDVFLLCHRVDRDYYSLIPATIWRLPDDSRDDTLQVFLFTRQIRARVRREDNYVTTVQLSNVCLPRY